MKAEITVAKSCNDKKVGKGRKKKLQQLNVHTRKKF